MLKSFLTIAWLFAFASMQAQTLITDSLLSGGRMRDYILYKPAIYTGSTPVPLLLNLHGYGSNSTEQYFYGNFTKIADTANFLVVHPNGTFDASGKRYWNAPVSLNNTVDDVAFINDMITSLSSKYNIDPNRIYSTGMSNGGFMSYTLACDLSNRITAIASVTGTMVITKLASCTPSRPVPVMQIHGTADAVVPYNGTAFFASIPNLVNAWVQKNNCNTAPIKTDLPNINTNDQSTVEHYLYPNGNLGSTVELYKVIGGAHTWPNAIVDVGITNRDFDASKEIWRFFSQFSLDKLTSTPDITSDTPAWSIFPNPAHDYLNLLSSDVNAQVFDIQVFDMLGRSVYALPTVQSDPIRIETIGFQPGNYVMTWKDKDGKRLNQVFVVE
jgi:polyhydroxybutyrate depolymerase